MSPTFTFRKIVISVLIFSTILLSISSARELKMVTTQWAPFYSDQLPRGGPVAEIATEAFRRSGYQSSIEYIPWERALRKVSKDKADVVLGAYYTDERAKKFAFSTPIIMVNVGLVANTKLGISKFNRLQDLTPYKIGVSKGWANSPKFDAASYLNKDMAKDQILNIRKFYFQRVDMISVSFEVFRYETSKLSPQHKRVNHVYLKPLLAIPTLHLMVDKQRDDAQEIIRNFNQAFEQMKTDGTYTKILRAHNIDLSAACDALIY